MCPVPTNIDLLASAADVKRSARQERRPDVGRELYLGEGAETPGGGGRGSVSNQETFRANAGGAGPLDSSGLADQRDRRRERPAPSSGGRGDGERDGELRPNGWGMRGGGGLNRDMIRRHDWHDREGRGGERMRDGARPGSVEGGGYVREHVDFDGARGREFGALGGRSSPLENDRGGPREMGRGRGGEGYYGPHDREGQGARDRDFESRGGGLFRGRGKNPSPGRGGQQREREWGREREMYDRGGLAPPRDNGRPDSWRGASFAKGEHPRAQHAGSGMFVRENTRHDEWRGAMGWFGAGNRREGSPPGQQLRPDNLYPPRDGGPDFSDVRSCTIRIARLPVDMQVDRLREELVQLARMHGRVSDVVIPPPRGELLEAFVTFVEPFMAEDARRQLHKLVFFDCRLDVELELPRLPQVRNGCADPRFARDHDLAAPRGVAGGAKGAVAGGKHHGDLDEDLMDDPLATCRLRISDLDPSVEEGDIAAVIKTKVGGGQIESILIRRGGGGVGGGCIAEVKMRSFTSSVRAKCELDGTPLLRSRGGPPRVEFRVGPPCPDLWLGSVHGSVEEHLIKHEFERFGKVLGVRILRGSKSAHVSFERTDVAEEALRAMRGRMLGSSSWRLKIDFWERGGEHGGGWSGVGGRKENREGSGWADEKGGGGRDRDMELEACRGQSYGASPGKSRSGVEGRAGNPRGGSKDTGGLAGDDREPYLRDDALDQALGKRCRESSIRAGSWAVDKRPYAESGSHASMPYVEAEPAHNDKTGNGGSVRVRQKDPVPNALTPSGLDVGSAQQSALPSDAGLPSCERTVPSNPRFPVVWKGSVKLKSVLFPAQFVSCACLHRCCCE